MAPTNIKTTTISKISPRLMAPSPLLRQWRVAQIVPGGLADRCQRDREGDVGKHARRAERVGSIRQWRGCFNDRPGGAAGAAWRRSTQEGAKTMSKSAWSSRSAILALAAASVGSAGCQSMTDRQRHTAVGAGAGAATGAVVGKATGGNAATGAVVGGAIGAVAGNLWSKRMDDKRAEMNRATQGTGIQVSRTNDNQLRVAVPSDFSFDTGSAAIKPQMRPVLDQFAQGLSPNQRITVVGHSDNVGADVVNNRLSLERAAAVREYLRAHGVDTSRVMVNGRGEAEPIASNDTPTGRAENRRVEIFLSEPARG